MHKLIAFAWSAATPFASQMRTLKPQHQLIAAAAACFYSRCHFHRISRFFVIVFVCICVALHVVGENLLASKSCFILSPLIRRHTFILNIYAFFSILFTMALSCVEVAVATTPPRSRKRARTRFTTLIYLFPCKLGKNWWPFPICTTHPERERQSKRQRVRERERAYARPRKSDNKSKHAQICARTHNLCIPSGIQNTKIPNINDLHCTLRTEKKYNHILFHCICISGFFCAMLCWVSVWRK